MKPSFAVIGAGRVGSALAILLKRAGYPVAGIVSKTTASAKQLASAVAAVGSTRPSGIVENAELVFIATPDREIEGVASSLSQKGLVHSGQIYIHTSGAASSDIMSAVKAAGAYAVSMHPLQSFANVVAALENLPGSYFAVEGDEKAHGVVKQLVADLGGISFAIKPTDKPLYHAAACIACNYLVALMHLSTGLFARFGVSGKDAFAALKPLVEGTINNISQVGPVRGLTGPIARGDVPTIEGHLNALDAEYPEVADIYRVLGAYTVQIAKELGDLDPQAEGALLKLFGR